MSEPIKKFKQVRESYSPKAKPEIVKMLEQIGRDIQKIEPQHLIDAVLPTGNNPWVGGCDFLRCFASLHMHLENMPPVYDIRYRIYRKFLAITGMGMVTTFTDNPDENNYSFEAAHDYVGRSHRFAGYGHNVIETPGYEKNELFHVISRSIHLGRPVLAAYWDGENTHRFNRKWRLFIGYDCGNMTLSVNEDGTAVTLSDWLERLDSIIIITQTGLSKPDIRDVLKEIITDAERSESQGAKYGYAAYEDLISRLNDDAFFNDADDAALQEFNGTSFNGGALGSFFWYHAEARGAVGEGFGELCAAELKGTEHETDVSANGFYGYNGHQTSYIGCMALRKGAAALRDKSHREILIYCLRQSMSNDAKMIRMVKRALCLDTPDVLSPKNESGNPVDYCVRSKDMLNWESKDLIEESRAKHMKSLTAEAILSRCRSVNTNVVDFNHDVVAAGIIEYNVSDNSISVKTGDNIYETKGLIQTKQAFSAPIRIDACIENKNTAFLLSYNACIENEPTWLSFNGGYLKNNSWGKQPGKILTWDICVSYCMDYNPQFSAVQANDVNISWFLQRDFMAVIVNGELVHYSENLPYTHFDMPVAPVGFSAFDNQMIIVKSLTVSELE